MFGPENFVTRTPYLAAPDEYFVLDRLHLTYVDMGFHLSLYSFSRTDPVPWVCRYSVSIQN